MLTFEQIDAAVKAVHDDTEAEAIMVDLIKNEAFTDKVMGAATGLSRDIMVDTVMRGETDQRVIGERVFTETILSIAITMLLAGRIVERQSAQSIATLLEGFADEDTAGDEA